MSRRDGLGPWIYLPLWVAANSLVGLVVGLAVGFFKEGAVERPILVMSVLLANVVGATAGICSILLFPRLRSLPPVVRILSLGLALLTGSAAGSVAVLGLWPLFVMRQARLAVAVVSLNAILALIVGGIAYVYETLRLRLEETLREVEQVRLVEARLKEQAARAELAALQARINPHFFFNTLNTIASLVEEDPDSAGDVCQTLADLFRYTFKVSDVTPVTLAEEIRFVRGYLSIERARFDERLRVEWDVDQAALDVAVPGLILQPLVENAVAHGIARLARGGTVRIAARLADGRLRLEVADDGAGFQGTGESLIDGEHGLGNVQRRLRAAFGDQARLELRPGPHGAGAVALLELPACGRPLAAVEDRT